MKFVHFEFEVAGKPPTPQHCEIEIPGKFRIQIQSSGKGIHVRHAGNKHVAPPGMFCVYEEI